MKIYFAGSIRGGRKDSAIYRQLISYLEIFGEVLTEHIGDQHLDKTGEAAYDDRFIHDRDLQWMLQSDVVVAEVTMPSLGVGYEIGRAVERKKPVLCLYRHMKGKHLSAMIAGSPYLILKEYQTVEEACRVIDSFFHSSAKRPACE